MSDPRQGPPLPLLVAAGLVALEGLALVAIGALALSNVAEHRLEVSLSVAVFFLAVGAGLVAGAWSLRQAATWARGPALLTQLIALGLAWNLRDAPAIAVPVAVVAVLALVGMLHPATVAALDGRAEPDE